MVADSINFCFIVIAYNHESYIIEHLESIKFLVEEYSENHCIDLIINDDASTDNTVTLIKSWLHVNSDIFRTVAEVYNEKNLGTCKSIVNVLNLMSKDVDVCKLTASDDVYSFENIFDVSLEHRDAAILSGIPLHFSNANLYLDKRELYGMLASQICYDREPLLERFKFLSINNAPNIIYNKELLIADSTLSFLTEHDVVEDWPIQIAIALGSPRGEFKLVNKVLVYYRRTSGSTYLVANKRFVNDKLKVFDYLLSISPSFWDKLMLQNRAWLFKKSNGFLNKVLNASFYIFVFKSLLNIVNVFRLRRLFGINLDAHTIHLDLIRRRAENFKSLDCYK